MTHSERNAQLLAAAIEEGLISPILPFSELTAIPMMHGHIYVYLSKENGSLPVFSNATNNLCIRS